MSEQLDNRGKILDINNEKVIIGRPDGSLVEVSHQEMNYPDPQKGNMVVIYRGELGLIVDRMEEKSKSTNEGQININLQNNNAQAYSANMPPGFYGAYVNKTGYILLALFLGGFGAHKFYSGRAGQGIIYIIFVWTLVPTVISLVECAVAAGKPADEYGNIYI